MFSRRSGGGARNRTQPSYYSPFPFHFIRVSSYISSLVVAAVMFYFMYHLWHDHFRIPWTFLFLMVVSLLTLISLTLTTILHSCHVLSPRLNLVINIPLLLLWALSFSLLTWNMSGTLTHICNVENWGNSTGIMICRIYKALFSFSTTGFVCAFAAVILDIRTWRKQTRQGSYAVMAGSKVIDDKHASVGVEPLRGAGMGMDRGVTPDPHDQHMQMEPMNRGGQRDGSPYGHGYQESYDGRPVGDYANGNVAWKSQGQIKVQEFGYAAPTEQTRYDGPGSYGDR